MAHSGSAVRPEVGADTVAAATAAVVATQLPEAKPGKIGGTAGLVEASAAAGAAEASDISSTSPGYPMAAVIMERTTMEGTARAGRDSLTGRTAGAAAVAADTGADTPPATVAVQVAGAAEAAGTERLERHVVVE